VGEAPSDGVREQSNDDWLPGYQVFGEGLLCVLDPARGWRVAARVARTRVVNAARPAPTQTNPCNVAWLLAHTLAHSS